MTSGKSTIGPILANTIGWEFFDLDRVIEEETGKKIKEIFEEDGEDHFRKIETETLLMLSESGKKIISLGGGTLLTKKNLEIIKENGLMIYLKSSPESIYYRIRYKRDRPAFIFEGESEPSKEEYLKRIGNLLSEREDAYLKSDYVFDTDEVPVGKTVDEIVKLLKREKIVERD